MAVLTVALDALRNGFNTAFPTRSKASDGWIGDAAHQAETSGHNPDDTAGVKSEYTDTDSKAEVRAIDVDKNLGGSVTMQQVIDRMLKTPSDLVRLRYIIFNRRIWSRNTNWEPRAYTGSNPHDKHAHFSGDPLTDENSAQWSVATFGGGYSVSDSQLIANAERGITALVAGTEHIEFVFPWNEESAQGYTNPLVLLRREVAELRELVITSEPHSIDYDLLASKMLDGLILRLGSKSNG